MPAGAHCCPRPTLFGVRYRQWAASPAQIKPLRAPMMTSLRWCMPRYRRAYATRMGITEHTAITVRRSHDRSIVVAMMANEA